MIRLIRTELMQLHTLRSTYLVALATIVISAIVAWADLSDAGTKGLSTPGELRDALVMAPGLVTAMFDAGTFDAETSALAARLAEGPPRAFAVAKELLNQAAGMDQLDAHLDRELEELARVADGPEFAEGMAAFFGKRAPHYA